MFMLVNWDSNWGSYLNVERYRKLNCHGEKENTLTHNNLKNYPIRGTFPGQGI